MYILIFVIGNGILIFGLMVILNCKSSWPRLLYNEGAREMEAGALGRGLGKTL